MLTLYILLSRHQLSDTLEVRYRRAFQFTGRLIGTMTYPV